MKQYSIIKTGNDSITINFAADELSRYLRKITSCIYFIKTQELGVNICLENKDSILIGLASDFIDITERYDDQNDQIWIKSQNSNLIIAGSNPRSVLFAVYNYLKTLGARWLYPGKEGEFIPKTNDLKLSGYNTNHKASFKQRGISCEGAMKFSQVIEFIDWMAKNSMNLFFMQFESMYYFYKRYNDSITKDEALEYDSRITMELKKRQMLVEKVGHGWINKAIGFGKEGWDVTDEVLPAEKKELIAEVNGVRQIWKGTALNTQMCMSNEKAKKLLIDYICSYVAKNPEIDILDFWIADDLNNLCECSQCRRNSPVDLYIRIVNELSERLFEINPKLNLRAIVYANIINPPVGEKINNRHNNVSLLFCPVTRCYTHTIDDIKCKSYIELKFWPELNQIWEPKNHELFSLMKQWISIFDGDMVVFDYYFSFASRGYIRSRINEVIYKDMQAYKDAGSNGILSVQTERSFWPTGIPMYIFTQSLWDLSLKYDQILDEYLFAAFGNEAEFVKSYFDRLYSLVVSEDDYSKKHSYLSWLENLIPDFKGQERLLDSIISGLSKQKNVIKDKLACIKDPTVKKRLSYISYYADFLYSVYKSSRLDLDGKNKEAIGILSDIMKEFESKKEEIEDICDLYELKTLFIEPSIKKLDGSYVSLWEEMKYLED